MSGRVRLQARSLKDAMISYLRRHGAPPDHAEIIADVLLEAELRGKETHGLIRLEGIAARYSKDEMGEIKVVKRTGSHLLIDGGNNPGYVVAYLAAQRAIDIARREGSAIVGAMNTNHCGMLGYYADMIRKEDLIGIATCNCYPFTTPLGGTEPVFGTNPVAVGIPTAKEPPLLFDASLASLTIGRMLIQRERGEPLPEGLAYDGEGNPTTDPAEARAVIPFGGHKGYGLMLISQILTTALLGAPITPPRGRDYGILIMAINPEIFVPIDRFKEEVSKLIERVKSSRKADGVEEILIPGERSWRVRQRKLKEGVDVDERIARLLDIGI